MSHREDGPRDSHRSPVACCGSPPAVQALVNWPHLVYAYLLENTRMVDIFRRVVFGWLHGEGLPTPRLESQRWIHTTEQLFFANAWPYSVRAVTSNVRPDSGAVRRNAYYRLLGMDLNHGLDDGGAYPYARPSAANRDFASLFEVLLAEIWLGWRNRTAFASQTLTDNTAILTLVRRIREMLQSRRIAGSAQS